MVTAIEYLGRHTGRRYRLAPTPFDAGGGGAVSRVQGDDTVVAKVFPTPCGIDEPLGRRLSAVRAMKLNTPYLTRVDDLLVDPADRDTLVGFTMARVVGVTLFSVTNPDERKLLGLTLSPLDRLRLAREVARAFEAIHGLHVRLADAHHRNVMVRIDRRGRVGTAVLLEPDTWLFEWRTNGRMERFTSLARADFLPAEFQTADLSVTPLTFESDRFALALLVSLALFDCTPFAFAGSAQPVEKRIAAGHEWVTPSLPHGATAPDRLPIDPAIVPAGVLDLLRRGVSRTPSARPPAGEWVTALADWHQQTLDRSAVGRFLTALAALSRARTLGDLRRRVMDATFATLRRFAPALAAKSRGWWVTLGVQVGAVAAGLAGLAVWSWVPAAPSPVSDPVAPATAPLPTSRTPSTRPDWRVFLKDEPPSPSPPRPTSPTRTRATGRPEHPASAPE